MTDARRSVDVVRVRGRARTPDVDHAATEEPLEIRLHDRPFAVIMRTPGADRELAAGFLLAERVIRSADDLGTIEHCRDRQGRENAPADAGGALNGDNIVNVTLANGSAEALDRLMADRRQVRSSWSVAASTIASLPDLLRSRQAVFDETGGLHAAGLFARDGALADVAEDVGRHNAVDKIVGRMLMREALPLSNHLLCVSGRTSFEIVQKAIFAGIPIVGAVSAPSSLAIELAQECGITLVGFIRGDAFNIYAHPERVRT